GERTRTFKHIMSPVSGRHQALIRGKPLHLGPSKENMTVHWTVMPTVEGSSLNSDKSKEPRPTA
ncbi:MAG TPA: hypothetical protein VLE73_04615, partial [Candidatus Saccharimonadales bacterium]|nr:hypothetical protein [Candidatus Saccharimonadales bacterium]